VVDPVKDNTPAGRSSIGGERRGDKAPRRYRIRLGEAQRVLRRCVGIDTERRSEDEQVSC